MKNKNILPREVVPEKIRLGIYKKALTQVEAGYLSHELSGNKLCLLLPCLLWDLESYLDDITPGVYFNWYDTPKMFPEMKGIVAEVRGLKDSERTLIRIEYLTNAINKLKNK
jgi:hypothetical protein